MKNKLRLKRYFSSVSLSEKGFAHYILPLIVVVIIGLVGALVVIESHADSTNTTSSTTTPANVPLGLFESTDNLQYSFPSTPKYAIQYEAWGEAFDSADATTAWNKGTVTFAELSTCETTCGTNIPLSSVINGSYDSYLTTYADSVRNFGHPVLLTFDHEFNGNWYPWGDTEVPAATWVQAWDHVTSVISNIAPNVIWVWAPSIEENGVASFNSYWPGAAGHVGVVGLDGYYSSSASTWANTFTSSYNNIMYLSGYKYGFIVAETGIPNTDNNIYPQITDLASGARSVNALAVMYFNYSTWLLNAGEESWLITSLQ